MDRDKYQSSKLNGERTHLLLFLQQQQQQQQQQWNQPVSLTTTMADMHLGDSIMAHYK